MLDIENFHMPCGTLAWKVCTFNVGTIFTFFRWWKPLEGLLQVLSGLVFTNLPGRHHCSKLQAKLLLIMLFPWLYRVWKSKFYIFFFLKKKLWEVCKIRFCTLLMLSGRHSSGEVIVVNNFLTKIIRLINVIKVCVHIGDPEAAAFQDFHFVEFSRDILFAT